MRIPSCQGPRCQRNFAIAAALTAVVGVALAALHGAGVIPGRNTYAAAIGFGGVALVSGVVAAFLHFGREKPQAEPGEYGSI